MLGLEVKRSKFMCFAGNAQSKQEADNFIRALRQKHPQASHVCWAYIAGAPDTTLRSMSDDGEPNGSAGMPMLNVLQHSGIGDIVVAVVRYFGGTKLGTGGLQRAYSSAVSQVLKVLPTRRKVTRVRLDLRYDYCFEASLARLFSRYDVAEVVNNYAEQVMVSVEVAKDELEIFKTDLLNITAGNIQIVYNEPDKA